MKIRCDVCEREDAVVFCSADEAALCETCDNRVHSVNKVAERHRRFSLVHPSSSVASPLCDICQERQALLFCKEDRAILCRECDYPIHTANEQTRKHCRFVLTGVKLAPVSSPDQLSPEQERCGSVSAETQTTMRKRRVDQRIESETTSFEEHTSSISEYLGTLPGWHVEEFFDHLHDLY